MESQRPFEKGGLLSSLVFVLQFWLHSYHQSCCHYMPYQCLPQNHPQSMRNISFICSFFLIRGGNVTFQHFTSFRARSWWSSVNRALRGLCYSDEVLPKKVPVSLEWCNCYCYRLFLFSTWCWHSAEVREVITNCAQLNNLCFVCTDGTKMTIIFWYDMQGRA